MNKRLISLIILILITPAISYSGCRHSNFGEGFGIGAATGLVGGIIASKIAEPRPRPVYHQTVVIEDPYLNEKKQELRIRENNVRQAERQAELERRRIAREKELQRIKELERISRESESNDNDYIVEDTLIETKTIKNQAQSSSKKTEKEIELEIIKEKKELLKEENRKKELEIKSKELDLKLKKSKESDFNDENDTKTTIKTISKKTSIKPKYSL